MYIYDARMLNKLQWESLESRREQVCLIMFYNRTPIYSVGSNALHILSNALCNIITFVVTK